MKTRTAGEATSGRAFMRGSRFLRRPWDWAMNASKLDLTPSGYEMGGLPVAPVRVPGKTPLV